MRDASTATLDCSRSRLLDAVQPKYDLRLRSVRPSVLDRRFCGDPWIEAGQNGQFTLYLGDYSLVSIDALAIDLPALNSLLDRIRHRRPRCRPLVAR